MTTIDRLLAARAQSTPDARFLRFPDRDLTFDEVHRRSTDLAGGLAALGVRRGDLVPVLMPNRAEFVVSWFALCKLGAVATLINTAMRGPALVHTMNISEAEIAIVDESLLASIEPIRDQLAQLRRVVVTGESPEPVTLAGLAVERLAVVESSVVGTELSPVTDEL